MIVLLAWLFSIHPQTMVSVILVQGDLGAETGGSLAILYYTAWVNIIKTLEISYCKLTYKAEFANCHGIMKKMRF